MASVKYYVEDGVQATVSFKSLSGSAIDPTEVQFRVTDPHGYTVIYNYPEDSQITRNSAGNFTLKFVLGTIEGDWTITAIGTGAVQKTVEGTIRVHSRSGG